MRGYLSGTAAAFGSPQTSGAPNITGMVAGQGNTNNISANTGCFSPRSNQVRAGDIGSGFPFYSWQNNFDASRSNSNYGIANEVRPSNSSVHWFIKY